MTNVKSLNHLWFMYYVGSLYEEIIERYEVTELNYIFAAGKAVAIFETSSVTGTTLRYLHHDHLGSIMAYSDEAGKLAEELSYDAWGRRRDANTWEHYPYGSEYMSYFTAWNAHGFGGHEHLEVFDMINMDGRMYDPMLGRFLSPDPFVQAPDNPQSLNRYAYCMNNPLSLIDPSGYSWFSSNWKSLLSAAVGIAVSAIMPGVGPAVLSAVIAGAAGGAAGALTTSLLNGANLGQIAKATLTGAFWGAASGAANFLSGEGKDIIANIFKHTFSQGFLEGVQGGNILHGFMMGAVSGGIGAGSEAIRQHGYYLTKTETLAASMIIGGTMSELGGGKFANGAITGAFSALFNDLMHHDPKTHHSLFHGKYSHSRAYRYMISLSKHLGIEIAGVSFEDGDFLVFKYNGNSEGESNNYFMPTPYDNQDVIPHSYVDVNGVVNEALSQTHTHPWGTPNDATNPLGVSGADQYLMNQRFEGHDNILLVPNRTLYGVSTHGNGLSQPVYKGTF